MRQKLWIVLLCACVLISTAACGKTAKTTEEPISLSESTETTETTISFAVQLAGTYHSRIAMSETMGVDLYLQIAEDGTFVFARDTRFETDEKGAGTLTEDMFVYSILNGDPVEDGTRTASYTVEPDGSIRFTSPMWFGATEPKITGEDGSVTYPVFLPFDASAETSESEAQTSETETDAHAVQTDTTAPKTETTKPTTTEKTASQTTQTQAKTTTRTYGFTTPSRVSTTESTTTTTTTTKPTTTTTTTTKPTTATTTTTTTTSYSGSGGGYTPVIQPTSGSATPTKSDPETKPSVTKEEGFKEGVSYKGSTEKYVDAMNSTVHYDVTVTFQDGQYTGTVRVRLTGGMEHTETQSYSGTYTVNGNTLTMTGDFSKGSISGNTIELTGKLSSFASSSDSVTVTR